MSYLIEHLTNWIVQCDGFSFSPAFILCLLKSIRANDRIECG